MEGGEKLESNGNVDIVYPVSQIIAIFIKTC